MSLTAIKICLLLGAIGHVLCRHCDCIITYTPGGRFDFGMLQDNTKMAALFENAPLKNPLVSILLGVASMTVELLGYLALCSWMQQFSPVAAGIMLVCTVVMFVPGVVHHVFCGTVEWFYIRFGRTEEARQVILEFFKKTMSTMLACFVGFLVFSVVLLGGHGPDRPAALGLPAEPAGAVCSDGPVPHRGHAEHCGRTDACRAVHPAVKGGAKRKNKEASAAVSEAAQAQKGSGCFFAGYVPCAQLKAVRAVRTRYSMACTGYCPAAVSPVSITLAAPSSTAL